MSRSNEFLIQCSLCKKYFDSAASLLLHLTEHVRKQNGKQSEAYDLDSNLLQSNNNFCKRSEVYKGKDGIESSDLDGQDSSRSSLSSSDVHLDSKVSDLDVNCIKNENSPSENNKSDELDPSEYCITIIDDQNHEEMKVKNETDENSNKKMKKKYACRLCSKIFGWSTDLKRHILIHTGERPFKCQSCNASFTRNFLLQKHLSKVHPCCISKEKQQFIQQGVELNLKLLRESFNIPKNISTNA